MKAKTAVLAAVVLVFALEGLGTAGTREADWKGAETFTQTSLAPDPTRCGVSPPNVRATFAGNGVDTVGGAFTVTLSGCLDLETLRVFDIEATDTYIQSGSSVFIAPADFTLVVDPQTCVATNDRPASFRVNGGTGDYEGAQGGGQFDFAVNWTPCNGVTQPTHVWFRGTIDS